MRIAGIIGPSPTLGHESNRQWITRPSPRVLAIGRSLLDDIAFDLMADELKGLPQGLPADVLFHCACSSALDTPSESTKSLDAAKLMTHAANTRLKGIWIACYQEDDESVDITCTAYEEFNYGGKAVIAPRKPPFSQYPFRTIMRFPDTRTPSNPIDAAQNSNVRRSQYHQQVCGRWMLINPKRNDD